MCRVAGDACVFFVTRHFFGGEIDDMGRVHALVARYTDNEYAAANLKALEESFWIVITDIVTPCSYFSDDCIHSEFEYRNGRWYDSRCHLEVRATRLPSIPGKCPRCNEKWDELDLTPCECAIVGDLRKEWKVAHTSISIRYTKQS